MLLFIHLILNANIKDADWQTITVHRGQLVTSQDHLAFDLGFTRQQIRTALDHLKSTGEITINGYSKYSVITVVNYAKYQDVNQQNNQQTTNKQPTNNQQATNKQPQSKNIRTKEPKNGKKDFIPPTYEEVINYALERNSPVDPKLFFDYYEAGEWKDSKGNPVQNWKLKFITWENKEHGTNSKTAEQRRREAEWDALDLYDN